MVSSRIGNEIPSSLDLRPLGIRFGNPEKLASMSRPSSKFQNVGAKIDHGKKERKTIADEDVFRVLRMKGENYGRIAPKQLAKFIMAGKAALTLNTKLNDVQTLRNGLYPTKPPPAETNDPKILLIDLRSIQEYLSGHIKNSVSMPAANIQIDKVFSQLNIYKNKPDKLLVFYNDDERHGMQQIKIIFEKGFDNCYLLSGGALMFSKLYPELMEGTVGAEKRVNTAPDTL